MEPIDYEFGRGVGLSGKARLIRIDDSVSFRIPEWNPLCREAGATHAYVDVDAVRKLPAYKAALIDAIERGEAEIYLRF